jgi:hypothetical protein
MEIPLGNTMRVVVAGRPRARKQYGSGPDGSREVIGIEVDASGTPMSSFAATLASPTVGWTEGASVVAPAPVLEALSASGTVVEITGQLMMSVRGGDYGTTRATVTGVGGIRALGSAIEAVSALAAPTERASR